MGKDRQRRTESVVQCDVVMQEGKEEGDRDGCNGDGSVDRGSPPGEE